VLTQSDFWFGVVAGLVGLYLWGRFGPKKAQG
jgi:hypothetical protein